jgi:hypothetical protein
MVGPGHRARSISFWLAVLWLASLAGVAAFGQPQDVTGKPWLFFDLGENTLVVTVKDPRTGDIASMSWVRYQGPDGKVTDARTYLTSLRAHGYPVGLAVNIPQEWGDPGLTQARVWLTETDPAKKDQLAQALTAAKMEAIRDYFEGRGPGDPPDQKPRWQDPNYPEMDFDVFTPGDILVPFLARFRKPMDGPARSDDELLLYRQAIEMAARHGCKAIYQGADANDIAGAKKAGMVSHLLPFRSESPVQARGYYLSESQIDEMAR